MSRVQRRSRPEGKIHSQWQEVRYVSSLGSLDCYLTVVASAMLLADNMQGPLRPCVGLYVGPDAVGTTVRANFQVQWDPACTSLLPEDMDS